MYKENTIKNLDMTIAHMQYKQPSEFSETQREESEISEFSKPYKTIYESDRISTGHNYTESRANPDHPYLTRQGGQTPNSYNAEETNTRSNMEKFNKSTSAQSCRTKHGTQKSLRVLTQTITGRYWAERTPTVPWDLWGNARLYFAQFGRRLQL